MSISVWSSDLCSSDLQGRARGLRGGRLFHVLAGQHHAAADLEERLQIRHHSGRIGVVEIVVVQHADVPERRIDLPETTQRALLQRIRQALAQGSKARRVGKECVITIEYRWWP